MPPRPRPAQALIHPAQIQYDWNSSTNEVRFDGPVKQLLGYSKAELGKDLAHWADLVHPEDRPDFDGEIGRVLASGGVFQLQYRVRKADGSYVSVEDVGQFVRDQKGDRHRMVGFVTDITLRLRDKREVDRQANFARFNPNPVLELSATGEINFANDAAHQMMRGLGQDTLKAILPPNTNDLLGECLATQVPTLRIEIEAGNRTLSWSFFPIPGRDIVHCYGGDITERKRLEEHFRHAQKMEAVGHLSGGIAHDFNNLLTVIQSHAGMMQGNPALAPELAPSVSGIVDAAERASHLTQQLLTFSRNQPMQIRVLDLRQVLTEMTQLLSRIMGEDMTVDFTFSEEPQVVKADVGMMEQVMMNLAVNARDASPSGGRLHIALQTTERIDRGTGASETCVRWSVADTGHGIPRHILPRVFDPFFTTKEVGKGTGLGLATVYSIVQQHGGQIEVTSAVGIGTTFVIYLPRCKETPDRTIKAHPTVASRGTETILLVEDELAVRVLVEQILFGAGYRVLAVENASNALSIWKNHHSEIALLLTDLVMPGSLGGLGLAEKLQAEMPSLKVIYMTGYSPDITGNNSFLVEGVNFLRKPFGPDQLLAAVEASLDATTPASVVRQAKPIPGP